MANDLWLMGKGGFSFFCPLKSLGSFSGEETVAA
jgi:hypothetical protein